MFGDKTEYPTLTRLSYCQCRLKLVFDAICKKFHWKHLAVIYDKMDLFSFTVGNVKDIKCFSGCHSTFDFRQWFRPGLLIFLGRILINGLKEEDYEVYGKDIDGTQLLDLDEALDEISSHARSNCLFQDFLVPLYWLFILLLLSLLKN